MRFMVLLKATKDFEAGQPPGQVQLRDMLAYNEELVKAGVMVAGEGLQSSAKGARVKFQGKDRSVIDGPFAETKELIAGFWIFETGSLSEAVDWVRKCPIPHAEDAEIEVRQICSGADVREGCTPEQQEKAAEACALADQT